MSRAFVKEGDGALDPLPDLPVSPHPNYVTPTGLAALQARLRETQATLARLKARPDRLDKLPEAAAERDIRYLEARLRSAILIDPATLRSASTSIQTVTVVAATAARAESLTKPGFLRPLDDYLAWLPTRGAAALLIDADGVERTTPNWSDYA